VCKHEAVVAWPSRNRLIPQYACKDCCIIIIVDQTIGVHNGMISSMEWAVVCGKGTSRITSQISCRNSAAGLWDNTVIVTGHRSCVGTARGLT